MRHHLDYHVYIQPRDWDLWSHDDKEFRKVVESIGPMAKASYAEYAILFEGSDEQRAYCRCVVGYDVDGCEIKISIEKYHSKSFLCLNPKYGVTDTQLRIAINAFQACGHTIIATKGFHLWRYGRKMLHPDFVEKIDKAKMGTVFTITPKS